MTTAEARRERLQALARRGLAIPPAAWQSLEQNGPPLALLASWRWTAAIWTDPPRVAAYASETAHERAVALWRQSREHVRTQTAALRGLEAQQQAAADVVREAKERAKREALIARLRTRYLATPGATEEAFAEDLPGLLREAARAAALADDDTPAIDFAGVTRL